MVVGAAVGGTIGFLLFVVLGFCLWVRHKNKKQQEEQQQKGPEMQEEGSSLGAPPVNRSSYAGSGESFPGTAGHEPPRPLAHNPVPQSVGYSRTSRTGSMHQTPPGVPPRMSGQTSSGSPLRGEPPLVRPTVVVSPSTQQEAISPSTQQEAISSARRLSGAPFPIRVQRAQNSTASPSQHTYTTEISNSGPDPVSIQRQPNVDALDSLDSGPRRPQSIHDPTILFRGGCIWPFTFIARSFLSEWFLGTLCLPYGPISFFWSYIFSNVPVSS